MATEIEIAWLAGLLEGEGCFSIQHHASPSIKLAMTDLDIVIKACKIMEMNINKIFIQTNLRPNCKPCYVLRCDGPESFIWMRAIRPHMGERRGAKIDHVISAVKAIRPHIDKGRDHCRRGHSIKYSWEYYLNNSRGGRQCKRCLGIKVKAELSLVDKTEVINPFIKKEIVNE